MTRILIVEDDSQISRSLKLNLRLSGYEVSEASSVSEAWATLEENHFDIVCLDIGLPDGSGMDLCQKIRMSGNDIPVLFISALTDEKIVVKAISAGGDDYIRKPFGMDELKARIQKALKRFAAAPTLMTKGLLTVDSSNRIVKFADELINLSRKEIEILTVLMKRCGDVVSRDMIISAIYEESETFDRTIDSHMSHLRKKLREVAGVTVQIVSVYGLGYRLEILTQA
jgi:DNA-binding response OmpR family regulator